MDVRCSVRPQKPCAALSLAQAGIHRSPNFTDWGTCCLHRGAEEHPGPPPRPGPPGIPRKLSESLKGLSGELEHCASSVGASAPVPAQVLPFFPKGPIAFLLGAKPPGRVRDRIIPGRLLVVLECEATRVLLQVISRNRLVFNAGSISSDHRVKPLLVAVLGCELLASRSGKHVRRGSFRPCSTVECRGKRTIRR